MLMHPRQIFRISVNPIQFSEMFVENGRASPILMWKCKETLLAINITKLKNNLEYFIPTYYFRGKKA